LVFKIFKINFKSKFYLLCRAQSLPGSQVGERRMLKIILSGKDYGVNEKDKARSSGFVLYSPLGVISLPVTPVVVLLYRRL